MGNEKLALSPADRYKPETIATLEKHAESQFADGSYDVDANLALLKLYQFHPSKRNLDVIVKVLLKSLMALPDADFSLCCALLGEDSLGHEAVQQVWALQQLLEQCKFAEFWKQVSKSNLPFKQCKGFDEAVQTFCVRILESTFQTAPIALVSRWLNMDEAHTKSFLEKRGWTAQGADWAVPGSKENTPKPVLVQENLKFEQLTKLIGLNNVLE